MKPAWIKIIANSLQNLKRIMEEQAVLPCNKKIITKTGLLPATTNHIKLRCGYRNAFFS